MYEARMPKDVRDYLNREAAHYASDPSYIPFNVKKIRGAVRKTLAEYASDYMRKIALRWLFDPTHSTPMSTKELTDAQIMALHRWINSNKINDLWIPSESFTDEFRFVVWQATRDRVSQRVDIFKL